MALSGTLIAVTLTAFIFLITRSPNSVGETGVPSKHRSQAELKIIGPFSILYSFLTSFVAYVLFSIMSRFGARYFSEALKPREDFYSWLPPFHLTTVVLFLSILTLAFGVYYVTRSWLTEKSTEPVPDEVKFLLLGVVYRFSQLSPPLLFLYFHFAILYIWEIELLGENFWGRGVFFVVSASAIACSLVPYAGRALASVSPGPLRLMKSYAAVIFLLAAAQVTHNFFTYGGFDVAGLEILRVCLGSLLASFLATNLSHLIRSDYSSFGKEGAPSHDADDKPFWNGAASWWKKSGRKRRKAKGSR